jgi:hypothetical protein
MTGTAAQAVLIKSVLIQISAAARQIVAR